MKENKLYGIESLKKVSPETLKAMWEQGNVIKRPKNTTFIRARETVNYIYFVLSGKVIVYTVTRHGKRKIMFVYGSGVLVNENVMNQKYSSTFCDTIEECSLFVIDTVALLNLMEKDFSLAKAILEEQERKIWRLGHQLKNTMGSIYMEQKLAAKLWKLARDFGKPVEDGVQIDITMTVTFLADLMGAPRETISRLCKTLTDYGLMKMEKRRITIADPDRLALFYREGKLTRNK